jgi:GMP synthase-like glutamine amidotransferase
MKIHILQHAHFEGPGYITEWVAKHSHNLTFTRFYETFAIPLPVDIDLLIVLGGPMSVNDTKQYPWLCDEKDYIYHLAKNGCKILGICLGAQLIASAFGLDVYPSRMKEIGWFPVQKNPHLEHDFLKKLSAKLPAFHWHGETFEIPGRADRLFSSEACNNQGFVINKRVFALQFHWEVNKESVQQLIAHSGDDLSKGQFVQSAESLLATDKDFAVINQRMEELLDYIANL